MDKVTIIDNYIKQSEVVLEKQNKAKAEVLVREIVGVYISEIEKITQSIKFYNMNSNYLLQDLKILKSKLENYKANLLREEEFSKQELEKLKYKKETVMIKNNVSSISNANIDFNSKIGEIYFTSDKYLEEKEKKKLLDEINELKKLLEEDSNKSDVFEKVKSILNKAMKGYELLKIVLPLIASLL